MADQIEGVMTDAPDAWTSQMSSLESMTEDGTFRIVVTQNGGLAYAAGEEQPTDSQLVQAADSIDETDAFISVGDRSVYRIDNTLSGGTWSLYLFGTRQEHLGSGLKVILALAAIGLIFIVFLTILMTNRFLTRFVVRKIEEPLDLLSEGARRLGDGDLDYRIAYTGKDEFAPVCGAFNEMAARLKESVERTRRDEESRKELLAGISHDLRSPLTSIRAYVEGLLDGVAQTEESQAAVSPHHPHQGGGHRPAGVPALSLLQAGSGGGPHGDAPHPPGRVCRRLCGGGRSGQPDTRAGDHGGAAGSGDRLRRSRAAAPGTLQHFGKQHQI